MVTPQHHTAPRDWKSGLPYSLKGRRRPSFQTSLQWAIKMPHDPKPRPLKSAVLHHPLPKLQYEMDFLERCLRPAWVGSTSPVCLLRAGNTPTSHRPLSAPLPNLSVRILWPVGNSWVLVAAGFPGGPALLSTSFWWKRRKPGQDWESETAFLQLQLISPGVLSLCFHPKREGEVILAPKRKKNTT